MPPPVRRFPDTARALAELLGATFTGGNSGTYTPPNFDGLLPYVRVTRTGGGSTRVDDAARVDIDIFDINAGDAMELAEDIRQWLLDAPRRSGPVIFDRITCDLGPTEVAPWAPKIKRINMGWTVVARRYTVS